MNSMHRYVLPLLLGAAIQPAAGTAEGSRQALLDHLTQSSAEFLDSVEGLTPEQWNYKPAADRWSIAECAEHIALSEDFLRDIVERKVLSAAPRPERIDGRKASDSKVLTMVTNRSVKVKAPEPLAPARRFSSPEAAVQHFQESRTKTAELARSRNDLREHASSHPVFQELDAHQWLLFVSGHTMRHTAQIREVKSAPGFPGKRSEGR